MGLLSLTACFTSSADTTPFLSNVRAFKSYFSNMCNRAAYCIMDYRIFLTSTHNGGDLNHASLYLYAHCIDFQLTFTSAAADLNDLHVLDPVALVWSKPVTSGVPPSPRDGLGFTSLDGRLYAFAGGYYDRIIFEGKSKLTSPPFNIDFLSEF